MRQPTSLLPSVVGVRKQAVSGWLQFLRHQVWQMEYLLYFKPSSHLGLVALCRL